ncbi:P-loop containing nucleoside triphosphate hydrolase protein [Scheffersomyces coipomensis]|uniref:P-loop containing nucleoside triphosphate hydrolase protein n=1 Tax=Scheffersomyces coipomensis TaxID=1788519 RepID=UPI00315D2B6D
MMSAVEPSLGDLNLNANFSFGESSLFEENPLKTGESTVDTNNQSQDQDDESSQPISSGQIPLEASIEEDDEDEIFMTNSLPISPVILPPKEVRLFNGSTINLKPKRPTHPSSDSISEKASVLSLDDLYSKANLRNSVKQNNLRLQELNEPKSKPTKKQRTEVLTEKYRPSNFIQLCSAGNDKQYRSVLHWLKKWSGVVFGEDVEVDENNNDPYGRPYKKILLVHGPPGIGKTSAIHVLAKQLGYSVAELNASNSMDTQPGGDQTTSGGGVNAALKLKIINSLTSNTITSDGKPSCLVIDEVDSLMNLQELVRVLQNILQADQKSTFKKLNRGSIDESSNKKKSNGKDFRLSRPIICIANDIYNTQSIRSSPMEKLRPLCEIINFKKPTASVKSIALRSIKEYLMKININEKYGLSLQEVGEIIELCDGDIRASLNYLQFNGRKIDAPQTLLGDAKPSSSMDKQNSWFAVIEKLFKRVPQLSKDENFDVLFNSFMNGECKSVATNSQLFDKVVKGCFNRYLDVVHYQDDSLVKPCELSDWLNHYDSLGNSSGNENYLGLVGLKIWSLFSEINPTKFHDESKLLIPNVKNLDYESFELRKQNTSIIERVIKNLPIRTRMSVTSDSGMYFIPYLNKILTPIDLSSKMRSNLSDFEKQYIDQVTDIVKTFDIKLENERDLETGQVLLQFQPNWESLTQFQAINNTKHIQIKRQYLFPLIAAELEKHNTILKPIKRTNVEVSRISEEEMNKKRLKVTSSVDFFKKRYDDINSITQSQPLNSSSVDKDFQKSRIWVKYNEGFSNAVRKNITWNDIWLP